MSTTKTKTTKTASKPKAKAAKPKPAAAKTAPSTTKKLSALDAAAKVLNETGGSMTTKGLIETMAAKKLWSSPNGKTPAATLYAAILREVTTKGTASRFQKTEPGKFAATGTSGTDSAPAKTKKPKAAKGAKAKSAEKAATQPVAPAATPTVPDGTPGPESPSELFRT